MVYLCQMVQSSRDIYELPMNWGEVLHILAGNNNLVINLVMNFYNEDSRIRKSFSSFYLHQNGIYYVLKLGPLSKGPDTYYVKLA
jgi:hypothetical protein